MGYTFWCPACKASHYLPVRGSEPLWAFSGTLDKPSFSPSMRTIPDGCHLYVTKGAIDYCLDSKHELRGQIIPMVDWTTVIGAREMDDQNSQGAAPAPEPNPPATDPLKVVPIGEPPVNLPGPAMPPVQTPPGQVLNADPQITEAIEYVQSRGYTFEAAVNIVAFEGAKNILAEKIAGIVPKIKRALGGTQDVHKPKCGNVGDTGDHGDLGTNSTVRKKTD